MKVEQILYQDDNDWEISGNTNLINAQLVLAFVYSGIITEEKHYNYLKQRYPNADIIMVSTAGEIFDTHVYDMSLSAVAIQFDDTPIKVIQKTLRNQEDSFNVGKSIAQELESADLRHVLIFSEGVKIYATQMIEGVESVVDTSVGITGGLAGDGNFFRNTYLKLNATPDDAKHIVMVGFYGDSINIGKSSVGGWDPFGQKRIVTKSNNNVVYEFDGEPALDLYEKYLGELAAELPKSGVMFPLSISMEGVQGEKVRTLLDINKEDRSVVFAGEVEQGSTAELMKANFERLIEGASLAAEKSKKQNDSADLALLISCVGRKLVLGQRTEEELEIIKDILGDGPIMTGFYSYGEIGPSEFNDNDCKLHNQTMTITLLSER